MQIPIASSLYCTIVVIRRPEIWGPNFYSPFFQYRQCFHENIINNHTNHKNYNATMHQSFSTYFNSIGKKIHTLPRWGLVTIQIVRHIWCSNNFWCGFVCQGVFFHTNAVLKSCTFYTGSIVALLDLIFKLQYLMNYSSDFNNFCRFQLLAVCTTLL